MPSVNFIRSSGQRAVMLPKPLTFDTCLALVLPKTHPMYAGIVAVRTAHDRSVRRYPMPYIKLLYPFLMGNHQADKGTEAVSPLARVKSALGTIKPFTMHLSEIHSHYPPLKDTTTVPIPNFSLRPAPSTVPLLSALQSALVREFQPEIQLLGQSMRTGIQHPYRPGGGVHDPDTWEAFLPLGRADEKDDFDVEKAREEFEKGVWGEWSAGDKEAAELAWLVDRVCLLKRKRGAKFATFKVAREIGLGGLEVEEQVAKDEEESEESEEKQ